MNNILDGKEISKKIQITLKKKVENYVSINIRPPCLYIIQIGYNEGSNIYIRCKKSTCKSIGYKCIVSKFPENYDKDKLISVIKEANNNRDIDGILIQLPLPDHLNTIEILDEVYKSKDVDGLGPFHLGNLVLRSPTIHSCTPYGIMTLLKYYSIDVKGKHAVVVGSSNIVGKPMILELLIANATCTICNSFTENLEVYVKMADILIVAIGKIGVIKSEWIKEGSVVIEVGINRNENDKLCGDIDFETAKHRASFITPVPGGVGPMTVITLMQNLMQIYEHNLYNSNKISLGKKDKMRL